MNCSICQLEIPAVGDWTHGNNAEPVNDGRCCDECNALVVIPARLTQMRRRIPPVVAKTHTPGPWVIHAWGDASFEVLAGDSCVCNVPYGDDDGAGDDRHDVIELNARLIAAAPELLAALKKWMERYSRDTDRLEFYKDVIAITRDAIAKAEGRGE
jgi:hypothetical protein